ncbi:MAG: DUF262 domain-containing protein [Gammaproteobacteria bacterium]|nr:DUF262 domain-containing protein [Gammaproteobacteria bacterium]MDE0224606.1 DUF262 domain-containing protein [Gammaproteobacteria bacterium]
MSSFGFNQLGLASILKQHKLVVPANQRDYSWTEREVTTLLQDFARAIREGDATYFVGTIVTIRRQQDELEVVDGQQRLATTAILLATIRDYLDESEPLIAESIGAFLVTIDRERREYVPRLRLNLDDNEYFRGRLTGEDPRPMETKASHRLLDDAFGEARDQVENVVASLDQKDHGDELNRWLQFLEYGAVAVVLESSSEADAYRMFETLNDRGLRTSQADLVKNYLFGRAADRIKEVQHSWSEMRGALETIEDDDLTIRYLRHALTVMEGIVREHEVYETVQRVAKGPQAVVNLTGRLASMAVTYVAIYNADHEKWNASDSTQKAIEVLNLFDVKPMRPLMLGIAEKLVEKEIGEAMQLCVSVGVRLMIAVATRTGRVESGFAEAARKTYAGEIKTAKGLRDELAGFTPSDREFRQAFEVARVSNRKLGRYYLRSMELRANNESQPWHIPNDDRNQINLEHVLPDKPEENWPQFSDEDWALYRKRIGNLCLMRAKDNSTVKSAPYSEKKAVYEKSKYRLTRDVACADDWTRSAIEKRQKTLAKLALKTWPV